MPKHVILGVNDLATLRPDLAAQWHPALNEKLTPAMVLLGSHMKAWWQCENNHTWQSMVFNRSKSSDAACPICTNKVTLSGFNDLETRFPDIAAQWDVKRNNIKACDIAPYSKTKYWWICNKNHSWLSTPSSRIQGSDCPECALKSRTKPVPANSLALNNDIASLWNQQANEPVTPHDVSMRSGKIYHWICSCSHQWSERVVDIATKKGIKCPYCSHRKVLTGFNDAATIFPELCQQWSSSNVLAFDEILFTDRSTYSWTCINNHTYIATIDDVHRKHVCPQCFLATSSIQALKPELVVQFHPTKNGERTCDNTLANSSTLLWWQCPQDGYIWQASPASRRTAQCPVCRGKVVISGINDLATQRPDIAAQWDIVNNGDLTPSDITIGSSLEVWWKCLQGHQWMSTVNNMTRNAHGCPYCSGQKVMPGFNDLATKRPDVAAQWHPMKNGHLKPTDVTVSSGIKLWWKCDKGHEWEAYPYNRINTGCPKCLWSNNVAEKEITEILDAWGIVYSWRDRNILGERKELDFYLPKYNFAIEFNGIYWHSEAAGKDINYHALKHDACAQRGITLYQIWEDDWKQRKDIVIRGLAHRLGKTKFLQQVLPHISEQYCQTVGARNCAVQKLNYNQIKDFLLSNHIQGPVRGSHYFGLHDKKDFLRAVLVVTRMNSHGSYRIDRYASAGNVPGGFSKLLRYAENTIPDIKQWVTFADLTVSNGALYERMNFNVDSILKPDYMYVIQQNRVHKFNYRLNRFRTDPELIWQEGLTERELADLNGITRIWDAGKIRYVKDVAL